MSSLNKCSALGAFFGAYPLECGSKGGRILGTSKIVFYGLVATALLSVGFYYLAAYCFDKGINLYKLSERQFFILNVTSAAIDAAIGLGCTAYLAYKYYTVLSQNK